MLVCLGEAIRVRREDLSGAVLADSLDEFSREIVGPTPDRVDDARLHLHDIRVADHLAGSRAHDHMQAGEHRLRHASGVVHGGAAVGLLKDLLDTQAHGRGVAIAREVDEARHEAAIGVAADEEPSLPALRHLVDRQGHRRKVGRLDLEEFLARIGFEELHDLLARVRARIDVELRHHLVDSCAQDGDLPHGLCVHRRGVDPEEATLPNDTP